MGLLSFVQNAGEKLWDAVSGTHKDQGGKLKEYVKKINIPGSDKVEIQVSDNGTATVTGSGITQEQKEKILVAVGNVAGINTVEDKVTVTDMGKQNQYYTVKSGDTLSTIAKKQYGNANDYMKIFNANKPMLTHPDKIYPGQVLIIPNK